MGNLRNFMRNIYKRLLRVVSKLHKLIISVQIKFYVKYNIIQRNQSHKYLKQISVKHSYSKQVNHTFLIFYPHAIFIPTNINIKEKNFLWNKFNISTKYQINEFHQVPKNFAIILKLFTKISRLGRIPNK